MYLCVLCSPEALAPGSGSVAAASGSQSEKAGQAIAGGGNASAQENQKTPGGSPGGTAAKREGEEHEEGAARAKAKAKGKAAAKAKAKAGGDNGTGEEGGAGEGDAGTKEKDQQSKKEKEDGKAEAKMFSKANQTKPKMLSAQAQFKDLEAIIEKDPEWRWAKPADVSGQLKVANQQLEDFKQSSEFMKAWCIQDKFRIYSKKNFSDDMVKKEMERLDEIEPLINKLEKEIATIKAMHALKAGN